MTQKLGITSRVLSWRDVLPASEPGGRLHLIAGALFRTTLDTARSTGRIAFFGLRSLAGVDNVCDEVAVCRNASLCFTGKPQSSRNHKMQVVWNMLISPAMESGSANI